MKLMAESLRQARDTPPPPKQRPDTGCYVFVREYGSLALTAKDSGCSQSAAKQSCQKSRDDLADAKKHAESPFFETHAFRLSEADVKCRPDLGKSACDAKSAARHAERGATGVTAARKRVSNGRV